MRQLVILMKEPVAGRVKTRLGRDIGMVEAAWWFRHQCAALLRGLARDRRWTTLVAVAPDQWPGPSGIRTVPQGGGNLGDRMARIFRRLPPGPVLIVGADVPGVTAGAVAQAFALAERHGAVLGPSPDGGYWLIGLKRAGPLPSGLFRGVRWSGPHALADTQASLAPMRPVLAHGLADIDTGADWRRLQARRRGRFLS
jgi:hypothetical protein